MEPLQNQANTSIWISMSACFTTHPHSHLYLGEAFGSLFPCRMFLILPWHQYGGGVIQMSSQTQKGAGLPSEAWSWSVQPEIQLSIRTGGLISHEECLHFSGERDPGGCRMSTGEAKEPCGCAGDPIQPLGNHPG